MIDGRANEVGQTSIHVESLVSSPLTVNIQKSRLIRVHGRFRMSSFREPVQESAVSGPMPELTPTGTARTTTPDEISEPANATFPSPKPSPAEDERVDVIDIRSTSEGDISTPAPALGDREQQQQQQKPVGGPIPPVEDSRPLDDPPSPLNDGPTPPSSSPIENGTAENETLVDDVVDRTSTSLVDENQSERNHLDSVATVAVDAGTSEESAAAPAEKPGSTEDTSSESMEGAATTGAEGYAKNKEGGATSAATGEEGDSIASGKGGSTTNAGSTAAAVDRGGATAAAEKSVSIPTSAVAIDPTTDDKVGEPTEPMEQGGGSNETAPSENTAPRLPTAPPELERDVIRPSATDDVSTDALSFAGDGEKIMNVVKSEPAQADLPPPVDQAGGQVSSMSAQSQEEVIVPENSGGVSGGGGGGGGENDSEGGGGQQPTLQPDEVGRSSEQEAGTGVGGMAVVSLDEEDSSKGKSDDNLVTLAPATAGGIMDGDWAERDSNAEANVDGAADKDGENGSESPFLVSGLDNENCKETFAEVEVSGAAELKNEQESSVPEAAITPATLGETAGEALAADETKDQFNKITAPATTTATAATADEPLVAEETEGNVKETVPVTTTVTATAAEETLEAQEAQETDEHLKTTTAPTTTTPVTTEEFAMAEETLETKMTEDDDSAQSDILHVASKEELILVESGDTLKVDTSESRLPGGPTIVSAAAAVADAEDGPNAAEVVAGAAATASGEDSRNIISGGSGSDIVVANAEKNDEESEAGPTDDTAAVVAENTPQPPVVEPIEDVGQPHISGGTSNDAAEDAKVDVNDQDEPGKPIRTDEKKLVDDPDQSLSPERSVVSTMTGAEIVSESVDSTVIEEEVATKSRETEAAAEVTSIQSSLSQEEAGGPEENTAGGAGFSDAPSEVVAAAILAGPRPERNDEEEAESALFEDFGELSSSAGEVAEGVSGGLEGDAVSSSIEGVDVPSLSSGDEALAGDPGKSVAGADLVGEPIMHPSNDNRGG